MRYRGERKDTASTFELRGDATRAKMMPRARERARAARGQEADDWSLVLIFGVASTFLARPPRAAHFFSVLAVSFAFLGQAACRGGVEESVLVESGRVDRV